VVRVGVRVCVCVCEDCPRVSFQEVVSAERDVSSRWMVFASEWRVCGEGVSRECGVSECERDAWVGEFV